MIVGPGAPAKRCLETRVAREQPSPCLRIAFIESHYLVTGATPEQWLESMRLLGPVHESQRWPAHTRWRIAWWYRLAGLWSQHLRVRTSLTVDSTLPVWKPPFEPSDAMVRCWRELREEIDEHEQGHRAIGVEAAHALVAALLGLGLQRDAAELHRLAAATADEVVARFRARDAEHDAFAQHAAQHAKYNDGGHPPDER